MKQDAVIRCRVDIARAANDAAEQGDHDRSRALHWAGDELGIAIAADAGLPPVVRRSIRRLAAKGLSHQDIAKRHSVSVHTVRDVVEGRL